MRLTISLDKSEVHTGLTIRHTSQRGFVTVNRMYIKTVACLICECDIRPDDNKDVGFNSDFVFSWQCSAGRVDRRIKESVGLRSLEFTAASLSESPDPGSTEKQQVVKSASENAVCCLAFAGQRSGCKYVDISNKLNTEL
jgi:hypothetical protein